LVFSSIVGQENKLKKFNFFRGRYFLRFIAFSLIFLTTALSYQNCDNVKLSLISNPPLVQAAGVICAQPPSNLQQLNRFIFMFQNTGSVAGLDPGTATAPARRVTALTNFINKYQNDPNFTIAVGSLSGGVSGFLPDPNFPGASSAPTPQPNCTFFSPSLSSDYSTLTTSVLPQITTEANAAQGSSPYGQMLSTIQTCVQNDLVSTVGAQYNVVLVVDGAQNDETIATVQTQVTPLVKLGVPQGATVSNLNLYIVNLDSFNDSPDALTNMSDIINTAYAAGGLFSKSVTVQYGAPIDYSTLGVFRNPNYRIKQLVVTNMNAAIEADGTQGVDSDSDGIPDDLDPYPVDYAGSGMAAYNQFLANANTNAAQPATGCGDLVYQRNQGSCPSTCNVNLRYIDTDQDGLSDCDESIIGSNQFTVDTDGDGMPDDLEYKLGLSPIDPTDRDLDPDGDGFTNYQEVMRLTSPYINDTNIKHKALESVAIQEFQQNDGTYCYNVGVSGVQVFPTKAVQMNTLPELFHQDNENIIRYLFFEVPDDEPSATPIVLQAYKSIFYTPATINGVVDIDSITTADFTFVSETGQ
jgi:hypothetical protein